MCGIAGILAADPSPGLARALRRMCDVQAHRGPDGAGYALGTPDGAGRVAEHVEALDVTGARAPIVALGHRRLAIIDVAGGFQPMGDPGARVWLTYNGEVYNFRELARELAERGHVFRTRSDTEVVLAAYLEWGAAGLERLVGMFALAIWDGRDRSLLLARDPVGVKPLHWAHQDGRFLFASELKGVRAGGELDRALDLAALDRYLDHDYVPAPFTIFRSVRKLEAARSLTVRWEPGRLTVEEPRRYWQLAPRVDPAPSAADWIDGVRERIERSVKAQLVSDVPVGAFLSGGIDSSVVVASMADAHQGAVRTFSIGFAEEAFSELPYARRVAERCGTEHTEFVVTTDLLDVLPRLVAHHDEPFADSSMVPTHYVCRETRRRVTVALSGDGGDELFAGYNRYSQALLMSAVMDRVPRPLHGPLRHLPEPARQPFRRWVRGVKLLAGLDGWERYRFLMTRLDRARRASLVRDEVRAATPPQPPRGWLASYFDAPRDADYLTRIQLTDFHSYLPEDVLTKVDRASMMHSLEVRVPLLDHHLAEYAFRMPSRFKFRRGEKKWVLKRAFRDRLDAEILKRPKMGFGIPIDGWLRGPLAPLARELLIETPDPYLDPSAVRTLWDEHTSGAAPWGYPLWNLLVLKVWLHQQGLA